MYSVIIADDEKKIRDVIKNLIQWEKLQLELYKECDNGDELLKLIEGTTVDIVITDMQMPGVCGEELLKRLSSLYGDMPILVVSGYDDFKYTKQAIVSKAVDYILKPVDEDELNEALSKAIEKAKINRVKLLNADHDGVPMSSILVKYFEQMTDCERIVLGTKNQQLAYSTRLFLDENYNRQISLEELEKKFFTNKDNISRVFKNTYGVTISDYVTHYKVYKANGMLMRGLQVKEVAYELGFYDESHFHKKYKKVMGMSPSDYNF